MTLNQLIALFQAIGNAHYFIKTTEFGEVPDKVEANTEDTIYPAMYVVPVNTNTQDTVVDRSFTIFICDLVDPGHENLNEVLSDTEQTLNDILKVLRQESFDYTLTNDPILTPFKDGFGDAVAGWYAEITVQTVNNSGYCDLPMIDFGYPGGGGTPGFPGDGGFTCSDLANCPTIEVIEETLVHLQEEIDNLPPGGGENLSQTLTIGNSTGNQVITAGTNLSNILQVTDTVMGLSWNGTIGGNLTLDDSIGTLYHDTLAQIESQGIVKLLATGRIDIDAPVIRSTLDDGFNIARITIDKNQTVSDTSTDNNIVIIDNISSKGISYFDDYSANFTDNSLVTKLYVDNLTPSTPSLQDVIDVSATVNNLLASSNDGNSYYSVNNGELVLSAYDTTTSSLNINATTGNFLYSEIANTLTSTLTTVVSNQIILTSTDNASVNIVSPAGFFYPSLNFFNQGTNLLGQISAYAGQLYISGVGGTPLVVGGTFVQYPLETADTLSYFDSLQRLHSVTLGAGLSLVSGTLTNTLSLTGYVPYTGATTDLDMGTHMASADTLRVTGTAGTGYLRLPNQSATPSTPTVSLRIFADSTNRLSWIGSNGYVRTFDGTANTANRAYVLPDASGTIALTSDLTTGYVPYTGATTNVNLGSNNFTVTGNITTGLTGGTAKVVEAASTGALTATKEIIDAFLLAGSAPALLLVNTSNWTGVNYTGTAITGTYQGQEFYNAAYYFRAVNDNDWIRMARA